MVMTTFMVVGLLAGYRSLVGVERFWKFCALCGVVRTISEVVNLGQTNNSDDLGDLGEPRGS